MPVVYIERVADSTGTLAPQTRALKFGTGFTLTSHPGDSLSGTPGAPGQVTGYEQIDFGGSSGSALAGASLQLGQGYLETAGPFQQSMPGTGGAAVQLGQWTVAPGKVLRIKGQIVIEALVSGFGLLFLSADSFTVIANAGGGPYVVDQGAVGSYGGVPPFGGANGVLQTSISGNTVTSTINPLTIPAWQALTAYVGSTVGGTYSAPNPPTAIMGTTGCSVVSHSSLLYACVASGTSASSGGPTGTGTGITDGSATWDYLGPASAGLPFTWSADLIVTISG